MTAQRQLYKKNKLSPERTKLLNDIGFEWDLYDKGWETKYNQLVDYKEKNGNCNVSQYDNDDKELGEWVHGQRKTYKKNKLSPERTKLLNDIDFEWDAGRSQTSILLDYESEGDNDPNVETIVLKPVTKKRKKSPGKKSKKSKTERVGEPSKEIKTTAVVTIRKRRYKKGRNPKANKHRNPKANNVYAGVELVPV